MPRSGRGGARQGTLGERYPNRTDLAAPKPDFEDQTYGTERAQRALQQATIPAQAPTAQSRPVMPPPIPPTPLDAPTQRPWEPETAGLPIGPGPGPEALTGGMTDVERLRPLLPVLELAASRPEASATARNFVRRLRGALGPR